MMKNTSELLLMTIVVMMAAMSATADEPSSPAKREIQKEKQTKLSLYVTAKEAYDKWKTEPGKVKILDVRTPEEYAFVGHPAMAWNISFSFVTYEKEGKNKCSIKPNPEFVSQVKEWAKPTDIIMCMCRSGGRGALAVNLLADAGFKNVYNITDGFEGDLVNDPESVFHGKRMKNGWKVSCLPWQYDVDPERMLLPQR